MKRTCLALLLSLALILGLTSCSSVGTPSGNADNNPRSQEAFTVTDMMGNSVEFDAPAQRCVTCYYGTSYAMIALGLQDKLVGIEAKAEKRPLYANAAPALLELPNVGSLKEFNAEAAIALEPDVVFLNKKLADAKATLEAVGIRVLMVDMETQDQFEEMLRLLATVCGKPEAAENLIDYYAEQFDQVAKLTESLDPQQKPVVYMGAPADYLSTCPDSMYQAQLIANAGGVNAAAQLEGDYWTAVSYEQILTMNPDIMVLPTEAAYTVEDVMKDEALADVTAVKTGAVYHMPIGLDAWDSPGPSCALGQKYLLAVVHPELYSMDQLRADVTAFYQTYFGFTIDDSILPLS